MFFFIITVNITAVRAGECAVTGTLTGKITVSLSGRCIPNALVTVPVALLTFKTASDSAGIFTITGIPPGKKYAIRANKKGYKSGISFASINTGDITHCDLSMSLLYLKLLYPNGGESIYAGSEVNISWDAVGIDNVRLEFSITGGQTWFLLADNVNSSTGLYTWEVPDLPSKKCLIKISDTGKSNLSDISDMAFSNSSF